MTSLRRVLDDVEAYLECRLEDGETELHVAPDLLKRLEQMPAAVPHDSPSAPMPAAPTGPVGAAAAGATDVISIAETIAACTRCSLYVGRTHTVPGQGCLTPEIMFIGAAPGPEEDRQGLAFVDDAGQLLTRMIEGMGYTRDQVFISGIVKCRPPDDRKPTPAETKACMPYLAAQVASLRPKVIVTLGDGAARSLLGIDVGIADLRGQWKTFHGIDVMPTFHPGYLLHKESAKHAAWSDLKAVLKRLGRRPPPRPQQ